MIQPFVSAIIMMTMMKFALNDVPHSFGFYPLEDHERKSSPAAIILPKDKYNNPRWGEFATKKYAENLGFTKKITGDIGWCNPRNHRQYVRFRSATRSPKTITVYNSVLGRKETMNVVGI